MIGGETLVLLILMLVSIGAGFLVACAMLWVAGVSVPAILWPDSAYARARVAAQYLALLLLLSLPWTVREAAMSRLVELAQDISAPGLHRIRTRVARGLRQAYKQETHPELRSRIRKAMAVVDERDSESGIADSVGRPAA